MYINSSRMDLFICSPAKPKENYEFTDFVICKSLRFYILLYKNPIYPFRHYTA